MRTALACVASLVLSAVPAQAQSPGTVRVAIIDHAKVLSPEGVQRYRAALAQLAAEEPRYAPAENPAEQTPSPDPSRLEKLVGSTLSAKSRSELERRLAELDRAKAKRAMWRAHVDQILEPIRLDVQRALELFAKARGIGLLLDRGGIDVLAAAPGVDVTEAFIKEYDAQSAKPPAEKSKR